MSYALLIDDDPSVTTSARDLAGIAGLELITASTWDDGLDKFYALSPELVISDFNLPGSKMGLKLLLEIASLRPSTRVILLSAYLTAEDAAKIMDLKVVDDVVIKTDPTATARRILEEVKIASSRAAVDTDWGAFANASISVGSLDREAIDELDQFLISHLPQKKD